MDNYDGTKLPFAIRKSNQERIINTAFGASITAHNPDYRKQLCALRRENNFPKDQFGNMIPKLTYWEFGNCAETNAWIFLCQWRSDLQIDSRTISVCEAIQNWLRH